MTPGAGSSSSVVFIDRSANLIQQKFKQKYIKLILIPLICIRDLERHKKRLEEISKRSTRQKSKLAVEYSHQINTNKRLIHEI